MIVTATVPVELTAVAPPVVVPVPVIVTVYVPALLFIVGIVVELLSEHPESIVRPAAARNRTTSPLNVRRRLRSGMQNSRIASVAPPPSRQPLLAFTTPPLTAALRAVVLLMVRVANPVPPAVSVTLEGETAHVGGYAAELMLSAQESATAPAKFPVEATVSVVVLPVVAPEVKLSEEGEELKVNEGAVTVTVTVDVTVRLPLIPVTTTDSVPAPPTVLLLMVSVLMPVPPDVSVTEAGAREQVPAAVPVKVVTLQVRPTVPEKVFTDASVRLSMVELLDPDPSAGVVVVGVMLNRGPLTTTVMADEVTVVLPLVPVTVTLSVPLALAVLFVMVRVLVPVPPALSAEEVGVSEHVPADVPLAVVTAQVSATVPEKLFTEAKVMLSVTVAPALEIRVSAVEVGVTVNVGVWAPCRAVRYFATSSDPQPVTAS